MNNSIIPLLIIGAFGAFLIYRNRPRFKNGKFVAPFLPTLAPAKAGIIPSLGTREYNQWVQRSLNKIMETNLVIDGIIGPRTKKTIEGFQVIAGLYPIDGIISPQIQTAIEQFLEGF